MLRICYSFVKLFVTGCLEGQIHLMYCLEIFQTFDITVSLLTVAWEGSVVLML